MWRCRRASLGAVNGAIRRLSDVPSRPKGLGSPQNLIGGTCSSRVRCSWLATTGRALRSSSPLVGCVDLLLGEWHSRMFSTSSSAAKDDTTKAIRSARDFARRQQKTPNAVSQIAEQQQQQVDPQRAFVRMQQKLSDLTNKKGLAHVVRREVNHVVFVNANLHDDPKQGLTNALQVARLALERDPGKAVVNAQTWNLVFRRMIQCEFPVSEMNAWMEKMPVENLSKEMMLLFTHTLNPPNQHINIFLDLLKHYLSTEHAKANREVLQRSVGYLVDKLLHAQPSVPQVEDFVAVMRSSRLCIDHLTSSKIVSYCLDPSKQDLPLKDIARSFMVFLRENRYLLSWHSSLRLTSFDDEEIERNATLLEQQLESLMQMDRKDREEYWLAIRLQMTSPERLYAMARERSRKTPAPMDYQLYCCALCTNVNDHEDEQRGLARGVEIARWTVDMPGFTMPRMAWDSILLKMIKNEYPIDELIHWMDTQPVVNLTKSMIYVLASALDYLKKTDVCMALLEHLLATKSASKHQDERKVALRYLFVQFMNTKPSIEQLEKYLGLMTLHGERMKFARRHTVVSYYVNPLHHAAGASSREIANRLITLWHDNEPILKSQKEPFEEMGSMLGRCGRNGVIVAEELLEIVGESDKLEKRVGFAQSVLEGLQETDHEAYTVFLEVVKAWGIAVPTAT